MKISIFGKQLRITVLGLGLYLLLLGVLCSLGFWQLDRGTQKKQLLQQQQQASLAQEIDLNRQSFIDVNRMRYRRVVATGHYDTAHQFLVDNQVMNGKSGFLVLTPFIIDQQNNAILVNRGWVALGQDRKQLPNVDFDSGSLQISGRINHFPTPGLKLAGMEQPGEGWPSLLQWVDTAKLEARLGYKIVQCQLELDADAEHGYRREWRTVVAIPPEKHQAYAVQWFGLALALSLLFVWISIEKTQ